MTVEIVSNGEKYFLKLHYSGPEAFRYEILDFSNLKQIKEFQQKLESAILRFECNVVPTA